MENFQDMDFSQLFQDISDMDFSTLFQEAAVSSDMKPTSSDYSLDQNNMDFANFDMNSVLNPDKKLPSSILIPDIEPTSFVSNCEIKPTSPVSNPDIKLTSSVSNPDIDPSSSSCNKKTTIPVCSICGKCFLRFEYLKKHMKIHSREKKSFTCEVCSRTTTSEATLKRHQLMHNNEMKYKFACEQCKHGFSRKDMLLSHLKNYQSSPYCCTECNEKFCRYINLKHHIKQQHTSSNKLKKSSNPYTEKVKHFNRKKSPSMFSSVTFYNSDENVLDIPAFLNSLRSEIEYELKYQVFNRKGIKWSLTLEATVLSREQGNKEISTSYLDSNMRYLLLENELEENLNRAFIEIVEIFFQLQTNWTLKKIIRLHISTIKLDL